MTLKLINKVHLTDNVYSFIFQPSEPLKMQAGQFVRVELVHDNPDAEGTKRWFTNSAAPYEGILQITTRVTSSTFKKALSNLAEGSEDLILVEDPEGDFVWQSSKQALVFIAGGIGITPFYSMLKQHLHDNLNLAVTLIYAARTDAIPFKDELTKWQDSHPEFSVKYVIGERLDLFKLGELIPSLKQSLVYLSGPEEMVEALGNDLVKDGLAEAQLKQDFFPNYNNLNY